MLIGKPVKHILERLNVTSAFGEFGQNIPKICFTITFPSNVETNYG
jgi:hypothetical protein